MSGPGHEEGVPGSRLLEAATSHPGGGRCTRFFRQDPVRIREDFAGDVPVLRELDAVCPDLLDEADDEGRIPVAS